MAEAAKILTENIVKLTGGTYLTARYTDIIHPKPEENRTADEIIDQVLKGLPRENNGKAVKAIESA